MLSRKDGSATSEFPSCAFTARLSMDPENPLVRRGKRSSRGARTSGSPFPLASSLAPARSFGSEGRPSSVRPSSGHPALATLESPSSSDKTGQKLAQGIQLPLYLATSGSLYSGNWDALGGISKAQLDLLGDHFSAHAKRPHVSHRCRRAPVSHR